MQRRATRFGLISLLAIFALASFVVVAQADGDGDERLHRLHKIVIDGEHGDFMGGRALLRMLSGKGAFLGVQLTELTPELRTHFGVPEKVGVMVSKVVEGSAAEKAGLEVGDIIARVDDEDVGSSMALQRLISSLKGDETVILETWRDGQMQTLTATLEEREVHGRFPHRLTMDCDGGDCDFDFGKIEFGDFGGLHLNCGDGEDCDMSINCDDGDCTCVIHGEESDCGDLPFTKLHTMKRHKKHVD